MRTYILMLALGASVVAGAQVRGSGAISGSGKGVPANPAACLSALTVTTPCVAYQGSFTNQGVAGTTGLQTLYTSNAPAVATFLFCPNIFINSAGSGGTLNEQLSYTTTGGTVRTNTAVVSPALTGTGLAASGCNVISVAANSSLSFTVLAVSGTGTPTWETSPVVLRIH